MSTGIAAFYSEFTDALMEVLAENAVGPARRGRLARARSRSILTTARLDIFWRSKLHSKLGSHAKRRSLGPPPQLGQTAANNAKILHASFVARCCWLNRPSVLIHADPGPVCVWTCITEGICGAIPRLRLPTKRSASGVAVNTRTVRIGVVGLHKPASVRLLR
jgi:hypothetical protein